MGFCAHRWDWQEMDLQDILQLHLQGVFMPTKDIAQAFDAAKKVTETLDQLPEEQRSLVIRWVSEGYGLVSPPEANVPAHTAPLTSPTSPDATVQSNPIGGRDIKSFLEAKKPTSDNQLAAAVAYYYRFEAPEEHRKETINADDLQEACRLSGRERLGDPGKTLRNAKDQGYIDLSERGQFRINTVGENLVAVTLPSDGASFSRKRPAKKKSTKKKISKKAQTNTTKTKKAK